MNPLTLVKRIQNINSKEAALGISEDASWHAKYKDSAYVYVGGIPFDLTEGDLLAVFAQYGEIVDVNLVRDKGTGKSKGFAFVAYEDQRSTILAVDNLNGAQVLGRTIRVDHVTKYKKKEEEDEEAEQQKREARGVCRAFQRGECSRGDGCKFSHNEQRAANTGWGPQDAKSSRWENDKFQGPPRIEGKKFEKDGRSLKYEKERTSRDEDVRRSSDDRRLKREKEDDDLERNGKNPRRHDSDDDCRKEKQLRRDSDDGRRKEKRSRRDTESYRREDKESDRRSSREESHRRKDEEQSDRSSSRGDHRRDDDHRVRPHRG